MENPLPSGLHLVGEGPADGVVLEEERHGVGVAERVVDRDELDLRLLAPGEDGAGEGPTDPPEPVDAHSYCHPCSSQ